MTSSSLRRRVSVLLVGSFLFIPWPSIWSTLTALWSDEAPAITPDAGCSIDPFGRCGSGS